MHRAEQEEADRGHDQCPEDKPAVATRAAHDLARGDGTDDESAQEWQDLVAGFGRRAAVHDLEPARQEHHRREEPEGGQEHGADRHGEGADPEEAEGHDGLSHPGFDDDERGQEDDAQHEQAAHAGIGPLGGLLVGQADEDGHQRGGEEDGTDVVDAGTVTSQLVGRQVAPHHEGGHGTDRQVDEEDPVPAQCVGDQTADGRADEDRQAEDRAEETLVLAALRRREDVTDDGDRDREQRSGAESLDGTAGDEPLDRR